MLCNHTRQVPAGWSGSRQRLRERQDRAVERLKACRVQVKALRDELAALSAEGREKRKNAPPAKREQILARYRRRQEALERRLARAEAQLEAAQLMAGRAKSEASVASKKRAWNLGTSLKSYIDPRVYHRWGEQVGYDVLARYFPTALRLKFAWVRGEAGTEESLPPDSSGGVL